mmetsp:Transcript_3735/g.14182  ORF Transcript_3735/g.14182 Transcript_3735/m.14182 type:complete len:177 (+) Transcript_3735:80-610(+)
MHNQVAEARKIIADRRVRCSEHVEQKMLQFGYLELLSTSFAEGWYRRFVRHTISARQIGIKKIMARIRMKNMLRWKHTWISPDLMESWPDSWRRLYQKAVTCRLVCCQSDLPLPALSPNTHSLLRVLPLTRIIHVRCTQPLSLYPSILCLLATTQSYPVLHLHSSLFSLSHNHANL